MIGVIETGAIGAWIFVVVEALDVLAAELKACAYLGGRIGVVEIGRGSGVVEEAAWYLGGRIGVELAAGALVGVGLGV